MPRDASVRTESRLSADKTIENCSHDFGSQFAAADMFDFNQDTWCRAHCAVDRGWGAGVLEIMPETEERERADDR